MDLYLSQNTFEDELGPEQFQMLKTHIIKQIVARQIVNEKSLWWIISAQKNKETRSQIVSQSFKESVAALEKQLGSTVSSWTWNKVHTVEHQHPLGKVAALRGFFNVGPLKFRDQQK
jgi:penicillin amidase